MGCCQSTPSTSSPEAPTSRLDTGPPHVVTLPSATASNRRDLPASTSSLPQRSSLAGEPRPNAPLRPSSPVKRSPDHNPRHPGPWSREVLEQERQEFFDTRVTGRPEVWSALYLLCGMLRDGNLEAAQTVLDAAGLTCPTGRVASSSSSAAAGSNSRSGRRRSITRRADGVYDDRGELYEIPNWIVRDPNDIIRRDTEKEDGQPWGDKTEVDSPDRDHHGRGGDDGDDEHSSTDDADGSRKPCIRTSSKEVDASVRPESKGKGRVADEGQPMQLRARLSHAEALTVRDVLINVGARTKVSVLVRRIMDHLEGDGSKPPGRLRIVYLGRSWDDGVRTIEQNGYREGTIVQVMILPEWNT